MPFDKEFQDLYEYMKQITEDTYQETRIYRADDLLNQQNILKDIVESIITSDLIIADLTSLNPNVFYELGLAHALKKNVVLLTQDVNELPFDLRSYRVIPYSLHFKEIEKFGKCLIKTIGESINETCIYSSPITDFCIIKEIKEDAEDKEKNTTNNTDTSYIKIDEAGILDNIADLEENMTVLTEVINDFSNYTNEVTEKATHSTNEINKANSNISSGTATFIRKQARKLSITINEYVHRLDDINGRYEESWSILDQALAGIIKNKKVIIENGANEGFEDFILAVEYLKNEISNSLSSIDNMIQGANTVKGLERSLTRAITEMNDKLNKLMSLLKMSESSLERAVTFGKLIISKLV